MQGTSNQPSQQDYRRSEQSRYDEDDERSQNYGQGSQSGQAWNQGNQGNQGWNQGRSWSGAMSGSSEGQFGPQGYGGDRQNWRGAQGSRGFENQGSYSQQNEGSGYGSQQGRSQLGRSEYGSRYDRPSSGGGYNEGNFGGYAGGQSGSSTYGSQSSQGREFNYGQEDWTMGPHAGRGPKNFKRNDQRIEEEVNERLTRHGHLNAEDINVAVKEGEVTLTGTVDSRKCKRTAEDAIENIFGVREVHNQLRVKSGSESSSSGSASGSSSGNEGKRQNAGSK